MNEFERHGRKRALQASASILLVSIHTIYFYNTVVDEVSTAKFISQIMRFLLTAALLYLVYIGKNWARVVMTVILGIGIVGATFGLFAVDQSMEMKFPLLVMVIIYTIGFYQFGFSQSFKAFAAYQNRERNLFTTDFHKHK